MKQKLQNIFFLFLLGTIGAKAQGPVITAEGVNPRIGDSIILEKSGQYDNVLVSSPVSNGQNLVWDYTHLDTNAYFKYPMKIYPSNGILFSRGSGHDYPQNFPNGNAVTYDSYNSEFFISLDNITDSSWDYVGAYESYPGSGNYVFKDSLVKPLHHLIYPMTYGTHYEDTVTSNENYNLTNSISTIYDKFSCNAYGTLKLPNATYGNVLLVKHTRKRINSNSFFSNLPVEYLFLVNGIHIPVLRIFERYSDTPYVVVGTDTSSSWSAYYYVGNGSPLPLQISSFTASWQNKLPYLQWSATNTENTKTFNVQRSADGNTFNNVGQVAANTGIAYHFADNATPTSTVYYRLQQVDKTGKFFYSNTLQLSVSSKQFTVFPNPSKGGSVHLTVPAGNQVAVMIYDIAGKLVYESKNFTSTNAINTSTWSKGTYTVRVKTNNIWQVSSFERE